MQERIALLQPLAPEIEKIVCEAVGDEFELVITPSIATEDLSRTIEDADYAVVFGTALSAEVIAAAKKLKLIHKWGVGVENIDLEAVTARGIPLARTTGSNATPVAEFAVGMMVALSRRLAYVDRNLKEGHWLKKEVWPDCFMLSGRTIGLVGLGTIGQRVARRLQGWDARLLYSKRSRLPGEEEAALGVEYATLERILAESDIVSLHCPLTPETTKLIGRAELAGMKKTAVLINLARGGVVDEAALYEALRDGEIAGAAIDVFETEPVPSDNPLLTLENAIVTPHLGAIAFDNLNSSVRHWLGNIRRFSRGEPVTLADLVVSGRS